MNVFDEPKIDTHCHVLDPARFAYAPDVAYRPAGQEIGPAAQYRQRAPQRLDVGPLLRQVERLLPDAADRRRVPGHARRWLGF